MPLLPFHLRSFHRRGDTSVARPNASTPIGIASMVIGGLALTVAWIPYLGMLAVPVAAAGAIVGFVGIVVGRMAGQQKVLLPLWGMLLCGISISVSYGSTLAWQNRPGAPGNARSTSPPEPAIDMRHVKGPFVPKPMSRPTFVMPDFHRSATAPAAEGDRSD